MDNKLEQLTKKLYDEGLAKGKQQGEKLVAEAQGKAEHIVAEAEKRAAEISRKARAQAEELHKNTLTEVSMAGRAAVARIKDEIAELIVARSIEKGVHAAGLDPEFIKSMLLELARGWKSSQGAVSVEALLPEARRKELDAAFSKSAGELLAAGVEVGYSPDVKTGFRVGEKQGRYYIGFSDENLRALLGQYLRERVSKLLFEKA